MIRQSILNTVPALLACLLQIGPAVSDGWIADVFEGVTKGIIGSLADDPSEETISEQHRPNAPGLSPEERQDRIDALIAILDGNIDATFSACHATFFPKYSRKFSAGCCEDIFTKLPADAYEVDLGLLNPEIGIRVGPFYKHTDTYAYIESTNGVKSITASYKSKQSLCDPNLVSINGEPLPENFFIHSWEHPVSDFVAIASNLAEIVWHSSNGFEDSDPTRTVTVEGKKCSPANTLVTNFAIDGEGDRRYYQVLSALIETCGGEAGEFDEPDEKPN